MGLGAGLVYAILFACVVIIIGLMFKILPTSPFLAYLGISELSKYLPYINYFVPIDFFIAASEAWLVALTAFLFFKLSRKALSTCTDILPFK